MRPSPPLAQAAFRSVLDAACLVYVFWARFWDTTMVCSMWSGILCRVFMIRSSGIGSGVAASANVESSHSFQAAFHPCFQRVAPCHRVLQEEVWLLVLGTGRRAIQRSRGKKGGRHNRDC